MRARIRTLKGAKIRARNFYSVTDCFVRNLSSVGACLAVSIQVSITNRFDLVMGRDKSVRGCRVMWRRANRLGVEFDTAQV
jgi:hypothetical protein